MSGDRVREREGVDGRAPESDYGWSEHLGGDEYKIAMVSMAGETKRGGGPWKVSPNNDRAFAKSIHGRILAMVADGADGCGRWGGVLADKLISAVYEKGLSVESLRAAASVVSGILRRENVTIEDVASTFTGVTIEADGEFKLLHLGDSRAYIFRANDRTVITKLTEDRDELHDAARKIQVSSGGDWQSAVERAAREGRRGNVLTNAVLTSADDGARVEKTRVVLNNLKKGDLLILCSDGLEKYLGDGDIWRMVKDCMEGGADRDLAARLVREAHRRAVAKKDTIQRIDAITVVTVSR